MGPLGGAMMGIGPSNTLQTSTPQFPEVKEFEKEKKKPEHRRQRTVKNWGV